MLNSVTVTGWPVALNPYVSTAARASPRAPDFDKGALPAFVTDLSLTGAGLNPRLDWKVPAGGPAPTSASIQIRRIDAESTDRTRITSATLVHVKNLAPTTASYTLNELFSNAARPGFPPGLEVGKRYAISVQLEVASGGELHGRSRTFFEFAPLPAGGSNVAVYLPSVGTDGKFKFDVEVKSGEKIAIDPVVAIGYDYEIGSGDPLFSSFILPTIGDNSYELYLWDGATYTFKTAVLGGSEYFFAGAGVDRFRILGIEADAGLDPSDATAFVTTLTFAGDGRFTGTMTPMTLTVAVPEADKYLLLLVGLGALVVLARRSGRFGAWLDERGIGKSAG